MNNTVNVPVLQEVLRSISGRAGAFQSETDQRAFEEKVDEIDADYKPESDTPTDSTPVVEETPVDPANGSEVVVDNSTTPTAPNADSTTEVTIAPAPSVGNTETVSEPAEVADTPDSSSHWNQIVNWANKATHEELASVAAFLHSEYNA